MRRMDRRAGEGKGGRKMWEGTYRVIELRRGCAERYGKGDLYIQYCAEPVRSN